MPDYRKLVIKITKKQQIQEEKKSPVLRWIDNRQAYRRKIGWITRIPVLISKQATNQWN